MLLLQWLCGYPFRVLGFSYSTIFFDRIQTQKQRKFVRRGWSENFIWIRKIPKWKMQQTCLTQHTAGFSFRAFKLFPFGFSSKLKTILFYFWNITLTHLIYLQINPLVVSGALMLFIRWTSSNICSTFFFSNTRACTGIVKSDWASWTV